MNNKYNCGIFDLFKKILALYIFMDNRINIACWSGSYWVVPLKSEERFKRLMR